mgnify:CR=1 FL=1
MAEKNSNVTWYVHHIITALLIISGHFLPVVEPLTREGMVLLMSFIGAIYGWSFINMLWQVFWLCLVWGCSWGWQKYWQQAWGARLHGC